MATPKIDILVNLLLQLQPDPATTTLPLNDADQPLDYSRLIGTKVIDHDNSISQLISSLNSLYSTVTLLEGEVTNLYGAVDPVPDFAFYAIMGNYLLHSIEEITLAIGDQFVTLRAATGESTELNQVVTYENQLYTSTLASQPPLSQPFETMAEIPGWYNGVDPLIPTLATTLKNMWLTINDMRIATSNYLQYRGITSCDDIVVNFSTFMDINSRRLTLFFVGNSTIPQGFVDVNNIGASLTITDGSAIPNTFTTFVNVSQANNNVNGVIVDLNNTNINLYTTLTLTLVCNLTNNDLVCGKTRTNTVTTIATPCVSANIVPTSTSSFTANYFLQVINQVITYRIDTFIDPACTTPVGEVLQEFINPTTNSISYIVSGGRLTETTTYYVRMSFNVGGGDIFTDCPIIQPITTL